MLIFSFYRVKLPGYFRQPEPVFYMIFKLIDPFVRISNGKGNYAILINFTKVQIKLINQVKTWLIRSLNDLFGNPVSASAGIVQKILRSLNRDSGSKKVMKSI